MVYGSVCSGIEAATAAWHTLGWEAAFFSEIEKFPSAVLAHHHPETPNLGDMTKYKEWPDATLDVLVGGTPCQSYSVAGKRGGLDDPRGQLMLTFGEIAARYRSQWVAWENVPGCLSSNGGRDFASLLGLLTGRKVAVPGGGWSNSGILAGIDSAYGIAWRVLDAAYTGVPQRRRRVFVVGHLGDWRRAAAVLIERHSLQGHTPPRREAGKAVAALTANGVGTCGADDNQGPAGHLIGYANAGHFGTMRQVDVSDPLRAKGGDTGNGGETLIARTQFVQPLGAKDNGMAVAFQSSQSGVRLVDTHATLGANNGSRRHNGVIQEMAVRRLTPVECERLQGFPDNHTRIPWRGKPAEECPDGQRYRALGNSMAVPVMRWIGERMQTVGEVR